MKLTTEQIQAIVDGAPDGATRVSMSIWTQNVYFKEVVPQGVKMFSPVFNQWEWVRDIAWLRNLKSLSDLREILELRQEVVELEKRLQKNRSTIDIGLGDLEQLIKHARHFSMNNHSDAFAFDLVEPKPFISPSLKNKEAIYACYRAIIRKDCHFGWVARFELKEQGDE